MDHFSEIGASDGAINIEFKKPSQSTLNNFSLEYHTIIDRVLDERDTFIPEAVQTHVVDALDRGNLSAIE